MLITGSVMLAMTIVGLDTTIANVALPHMQSGLGASSEQIVWVLTSYLIATAIMTPLSGWLASRFGRKVVIVASVGGFTLASAACGLANSLTMMIVARLLQGICGAALVPLGHATLLDINPPERHGQAMAIAGLGAMFGPLIGPTLGGWLTDAMTWRWVFLINLPIGILALVGLSTSLDETREDNVGRFDMFGFATISIFLASLQLVLDRGQQMDWFSSTEIWVEATIMGVSGYLGLVHMFTARNTFVRAGLFLDRNFALSCLLGLAFGAVSLATVPLVTIMMQTLLGYTPLLTGLISLPRGIGTIGGLLLVTRLVDKVDSRLFLLAGFALTAVGLYMFSRLTLETDQTPMMIACLLQGLAGGLMIAPLMSLAFTTLPRNYRNEGAAIFALVRSIGTALGISILQMFSTQNSATVVSRLAEYVRPDNPVLQTVAPDFSFDRADNLAGMTGEIFRQAGMVAMIDSLWLTCLLSLAMMPLVLVMRPPRRGSGQAMDRTIVLE